MSQNQNFGAFKFMGPSSQSLSRRSQTPPKPSHHSRKSITSLFGNLDISEEQRKGLPQDLAKSVRADWPNWGSISRSSSSDSKAIQLNYTIRMNRNYRELSDHISDPQDLFHETCAIIGEIRQYERHEEVLASDLREELMNIVFSSNYIERAGLNLQETIKICEKIFAGENVEAEKVWERSEEYQAAVQALVESQRQKPGDVKLHHVIHSRREIIQHAKALEFIIRAIVIDSKPLSEDLICATHEILVHGADITNDYQRTTTWESYAGKYRKIPVSAGNNFFVVPQHIPRKMKEMINKFNQDIEEAEKKQEIDPFHLAAKYSNMFVLIHPFVDGNGRTCRLILNAILLKYAGTVVAFGGNDASRAEYITIVKRAGEELTDSQPEFAAFILEKASVRLKGLKKKLMTGLGKK